MRTPLRHLPLLLLTACVSPCTGPSTLADYEAARTAALAPVPAAPQGFRPDAVLQVSAPTVSQLVEKGLMLHGHVTEPVQTELGRLTPDVRVTQVQLVPAEACEQCLAARVALEGTVTVQGVVTVKVPITGSLRAEVGVDAVLDGKEWVVHARPADLSEVDVQLGGRLPRALQTIVNSRVADEIDKALLSRSEPFELARFEDEELPARAVRIATPASALRIEVLTAALQPGELPELPVPRKGWTLHASQASLLSLARRQSFEDGVVAWEIVPEPTSLELNGTELVLGLRLWMTAEPGWWRDYTVRGKLVRSGHDFSLEATDVVEKGASVGAAAADPLAALGQSTILSTIAESMTGGFDREMRGEAGGLQVEVRVEELVGEGALVRAKGGLKVRLARSSNR